MSYCTKEVDLLKEAGKKLAESLLPKTFELWYSSHATGCQMTIVFRESDSKSVMVWRGSRWYSSVYEFNDADHIPGIQPGFEFCAPLLDKYFGRLASAIAARRAATERAKEDCKYQAERERAASIARCKAALQDELKEIIDDALTGAR